MAFRIVCLGWAIAAACCLIIGLLHVGQPFMGFVLSPTGHVGATDMADWAGPKAGLKPLDRVVSVEGAPLAPFQDAREAIKRLPLGTPVRYGLADGRTIVAATSAYRWQDFLRFEWLWWLAAVVHVALGAWVLARRPGHPAAVAHWRYCQILGAFLLAPLASLAWPPLEVAHYVLTGFMLPAIVALVLAFPARVAGPAVDRGLREAAWAVALGLGLGVVYAHIDPAWFPLSFSASLALPSLALVAGLGVWAWVASSPRFTPPTRAQAGLALVGLALSLAPSLVYGVAAMAHVHLPGVELAFLGFCAFPAAIALAIVRHQAFDLAGWARKATLYALLIFALGALYVAAATLGQAAFGRWALHDTGASVPGFLAAVAVAATLRPLHDGLRHVVDRVFLGRRADPLAAAADLGVLAAAVDPGNPAPEMARLIREALGASWVGLHAPGRSAVFAGSAAPAEVAIAVNLPGAAGGALEVGPRADGLPYTPTERALVGVLASQAALGLARQAAFEERLRLEVSQAEALARSDAREALFRQVVHDLGTDLSNIATATELARLSPGDEGPLGSIDRSLGRIEAFLSEKRAQLRPDGLTHRAEVMAGLKAAEQSLAPAIKAKAQRLALDAAELGTATVALTEVELVQVITNVVGNASKFSPEGTLIRLEARRAAGRVHLRVIDDGPGFPDPLPTRGLGLVNARALTRGAGGELAWRNGEAGAIVEVSLPELG
jgi:signal transduction histidine kinase